jgi:transposase
MNFKQWIIDLFKDEKGSTSVKPVVAFIGTLFLCVTMTLNSYSHESFEPAESLVNAVLVITAIGMGADTIDKFTKKSNNTTENNGNI